MSSLINLNYKWHKSQEPCDSGRIGQESQDVKSIIRIRLQLREPRPSYSVK